MLPKALPLAISHFSSLIMTDGPAAVQQIQAGRYMAGICMAGRYMADTWQAYAWQADEH